MRRGEPELHAPPLVIGRLIAAGMGGDEGHRHPEQRSDKERRRGLMQAGIDAMAAGRVRAPRPTVLPLSEARQAHALLDAADSVGKIILHP